MQVLPLRRGAFSCVVIDDFYSKEELSAIYTELKYLSTKLKGPRETSAAFTADGTYKKTAGGVFLDELYGNDREKSSILQINRKIFCDELVIKLASIDLFWKHIPRTTIDTTLVNFYGNGEAYGTHEDENLFTALSFFKFGDYTGGDLYFSEGDVLVKSLENRVVIFTGPTAHEVTAVNANPDNYRVSMAQFIS